MIEIEVLFGHATMHWWLPTDEANKLRANKKLMELATKRRANVRQGIVEAMKANRHMPGHPDSQAVATAATMWILTGLPPGDLTPMSGIKLTMTITPTPSPNPADPTHRFRLEAQQATLPAPIIGSPNVFSRSWGAGNFASGLGKSTKILKRFFK